MGLRVFENQLFDHWLNKKSQDILAKMDKEQVTTEDMLILSLKAQTNHFHHMDVEFREEFSNIKNNFKEVTKEFDLVDKKFDRLYSALMWGFGLVITLNFGLYMKLFLG
ncbi:MAG: hypothetical protein WC635_16615 [Bacteriovorax sp.]|jgi:hypothetical protein